MDLAGRASTTDPAPHHPRKSVLERDLTGYGANPPIGPWPHGARIAISFVLNYEEGAELAVPRDDASEGYLWEWAGAGTGATSMVPISSSTSSNPAAARNNFAVKSKKSTDVISKSMPKRNFISEQDYEYGSRVGCWRILRLLAEFGFRASLFLVAEAGEKNRPFVNKCVEAGWEIVCHGVRWIDTSGFNEEMDMLYIGEALRRVEDLIGKLWFNLLYAWYSLFGAILFEFLLVRPPCFSSAENTAGRHAIGNINCRLRSGLVDGLEQSFLTIH